MKLIPKFQYGSPIEELIKYNNLLNLERPNPLKPLVHFKKAKDKILPIVNNLIESFSNIPNNSKLHPENYIKVNKSKRTLTLYDPDNNIIKVYPVSVGLNSGPKRIKGDKKTPESGDSPFYIESIEDSSNWTHNYNDGRGTVPAYGKWFMRLGGTGFQGIGIHGAGANNDYVGMEGKGPLYGSLGCVRLKNNDIIDLKNYVKKGTPVYINKSGGIMRNKASNPKNIY